VGVGPRTVEGVALNPAFWRGRRVFLTGHTGFKGAWLALWLARLGAQVTGYALAPPTRPNLFEAAGVAGTLTHVLGDVRDSVALTQALKAAAPEVVFHLAAQSLVRESYRTPVETVATNVMGTVHLLEAARQAPSVRATVVVTSDKCYANHDPLHPCIESDPLGGHDPYSGSKACAEVLTAAWRDSFFGKGPALATARAGNVIGGGDWAEDRLLPDAVRAFAAGQVLRVRSPGATRPWQHVLDPLAGYMLLAEQLVQDGGAVAAAWNFGPAAEGAATVERVVTLACAQWGAGARWERDASPQPYEAPLLALDAGKARESLSWQPRLALEAAVDWTIAWYRAAPAGAGARALCERQLDRYAALPGVTA
jgi:CDP-glucose 4,6-dehydratase